MTTELLTIPGMTSRGRKPSKKDRHVNPILGIRLPDDLMVAFRQLAGDNRRTLTAEVAIALENHLKANGLWPPDVPDTTD